MGIDDSDFDRLLAGAVPTDDPELGTVSAFLTNLEQACPPVPVTALEDRHLAIVAREARLVSAARLRESREPVRGVGTRLRRALATTGAGVLLAVTAGVGAAAAMGVSPLQLVPDLLSRTWSAPGAPAPRTVPAGEPTSSQQGQPETQPPAVDPTVPTTTGRPTAKPTKTGQNCGNGEGAGNATCTNGNSGKDNPGKDNPGKDKSGKDNAGKSSGKPSGDKGNSGGGNSGKGKGNSGDPNPDKGKDQPREKKPNGGQNR